MDLQLNGKTALVSGSTLGIGLAIARILAREGATVIVNGRTQARVDEAIARITKDNPNAKLRGAAGDLSTVQGIESVAKSLPDVDILVNNLGAFEAKSFFDITDGEWQRMWDTNVMAGVRLGRHYMRGMLGRNWGRIIFIASEAALDLSGGALHYGVTKTAVLGLSRGLAELTVGTAVTVNAVSSRANANGDHGRLAKRPRTAEGAHGSGSREGLLRDGAAGVAHPPLHRPVGDCCARRLRREPAIGRHERCIASRGRRNHPQHRLTRVAAG